MRPGELRKALIDAILPAYRGRSSAGLGEWLAGHVVLRPTESLDRPGKYDPSFTPYAASLLWSFWTDPEARELVVRKSSQSGLTVNTLGLVVRLVAEQPGNVIYAIDSASEARNISRRLRAMLEDCELTGGLIEEAGDDMTHLAYRLPGMTVWLIGAGSAGPLANKSAMLGVADELDKHSEIPGEAGTLDLLRQRLKAVEAGKLVAFSTPTVEGGQTQREWATGTRHQCLVPCPLCGGMQVLVMDQVRFDHCRDLAGDWDLDRVLRETWYECGHCKGRIEEEAKAWMLQRHQWRATHFRSLEDGGVVRQVPNWKPGKWSAEISDLYSQHRSSTWGRVAVEKIEAAGSSIKLHAWVNNRLGEPWREAAAEVLESDVTKLRGSYRRGRLPLVPAVLTLQADVQGDVQKWVKCAWLSDGTCYVVDWGETLALPDLLEVADTPVPTCDPDKAIVVQRALVDEGYRAHEVRTFVAPWFPRFCASKGRGGIQVRHAVTFADHAVDRGGLAKIPVCHYDDDAFKRELYITRIRKFDPARPDRNPAPRLWLPEDIDRQFVRELMGEKLERQVDKRYGVPRWVWKSSPPNDWGDAVKMGLVLWAVIGHQFQKPRKVAEAAGAPAVEQGGGANCAD